MFLSPLALASTLLTDYSYLIHLQVAHLPDKANNYLTPALSVLEKNT